MELKRIEEEKEIERKIKEREEHVILHKNNQFLNELLKYFLIIYIF